MTIVGDGAYAYEPVENWAKLPPGWSFKEIGGVGVDKNDNVYVFNRGEHPMIVFDREGHFLRSFGEGLFPRAHGVFMAPDDTIWLTDDGDHTVRQCTLQGKVLLTLGISGKPAPYMSGEPFHRCTHTAMSPQGDIYVSDGYGNSRVHKYTPNGKLMLSWGGPGTDPGECRCSTATANTKRNGTTCIALAAYSCPPASAPFATSVNLARYSRSTAMYLILARG
jgi:hypothetical protein